MLYRVGSTVDVFGGTLTPKTSATKHNNPNKQLTMWQPTLRLTLSCCVGLTCVDSTPRARPQHPWPGLTNFQLRCTSAPSCSAHAHLKCMTAATAFRTETSCVQLHPSSKFNKTLLNSNITQQNFVEQQHHTTKLCWTATPHNKTLLNSNTTQQNFVKQQHCTTKLC
jgi:hypothetical protein